jgi:hypothetical protein
MHSDWFNGIEILQGILQHREKVGYSYPCGLEKTVCKWDVCVPLITKGFNCVDTICTIYFNIKELQFAQSVKFINIMEKAIK